MNWTWLIDDIPSELDALENSEIGRGPCHWQGVVVFGAFLLVWLVVLGIVVRVI